MRHLLALVVLLLICPVVRATDDIPSKVDEYMGAWARQGRFMGTVLIARDGKVLVRKGYGMADLENDVPNTPEAVYRIGSITKSFTALAVLQLEEQGKVHLDDPVAKYFPSLPESWRKITLHHLLTHTAGIPDIVKTAAYAKAGDPERVEKALDSFRDQPLVFQPGEKLAYSNSGYVLLGRIIEKVSGKSYENYVAENIFQPAGMTHTAYDHNETILKHRASGYRFEGGRLVNALRNEMSGPHSAGALHSTVDDLYRFDQALYAGKPFSATLLAKAFQPYAKWSGKPPFDIDAHYGYGWMLGEDFGHKYIAHRGWVNGFISHFARYPDDRTTIITLGNVEAPIALEVFRGLTAIVFDGPYQVPGQHKAIMLPAKALVRLEGTYDIAPGFSATIRVSEGRIFARGTGQPEFEMFPESENAFFFRDIDSVITFLKDDKGEFSEMLLEGSGRKMKGIKNSKLRIQN